MKWSIPSWKVKFFSYSWVLEFLPLLFLLFSVLRKYLSSLYLLLFMLFIHVGKRSNSRSLMFFKIGVFNNSRKFTGKLHCWSLFLIRLHDWMPAFSLKKRLQHRCFHEIIARFLKIGFLQNTCSLYFSKILFDILKSLVTIRM